MTGQISTRCFVCDAKLESEKEENMHICLKCRAYGLLEGCWPEKDLVSVISDATCSRPVAAVR
jgi:hypothetical protein